MAMPTKGENDGMDHEDETMSEAIQWALRLPDADGDGWRAFTAWLSASPENLAAYERVAAADRLLDDWRSDEPIDIRRPFERTRAARRWFGGGISVAAVAAVAWLTLQQGTPDLYPIETMAGVRQSVTLSDGSEIHINGGSRLLLDRSDSRYARLERGEALFAVATDADDPFHVEAGETDIRNIGTVFDVRSDPGVVSVEVAEGAVRFDAGSQTTKLSVGEKAVFRDGRIGRGGVEPATVGGWREGRLSFSAASFAEVARDIQRASGIAISADPALEGRRFSGNIMIDDDRDAFRRRLAALLDVEVRLVGRGWVLAPSGG
jgi:transmembrane sensor